jgi:hypothetical protein
MMCITPQRTPVELALLKLILLKATKRKIDAGTATHADIVHYEATKESCWLDAERALHKADRAAGRHG